MIYGALGQLALGQSGTRVFPAWSVDVGAFTLSGQDADFSVTILFSVDVGAFTLTGQNVGLISARSIPADVGSFTLSGQDATLRRGYSTSVDAGAFTLTGQDAGQLRDYAVAADYGAFTLNGQDIIARQNHVLIASHLPSYSNYTTFLGFGALGANALGGSYDFDNQPATTFKLTAPIAVLRRGFSTQVDTGAFDFVGNDIDWYRTYVLAADAGAFTFTGQTAALPVSMPANAGAFTVVGYDVTFNRVRKRLRAFSRAGPSVIARAA